jgi:hypothetical protein
MGLPPAALRPAPRRAARDPAAPPPPRPPPPDCLLLAGSAIVEEAVLTGESTPQWKAAAGEGVDPQERLHIKTHKHHVLFGGTKILQHTGDKGARLRCGRARRAPAGRLAGGRGRKGGAPRARRAGREGRAPPTAPRAADRAPQDARRRLPRHRPADGL